MIVFLKRLKYNFKQADIMITLSCIKCLICLHIMVAWKSLNFKFIYLVYRLEKKNHLKESLMELPVIWRHVPYVSRLNCLLKFVFMKTFHWKMIQVWFFIIWKTIKWDIILITMYILPSNFYIMRKLKLLGQSSLRFFVRCIANTICWSNLILQTFFT